LKGVVVAFSGGVDSTLLLKVCIDALGASNVLAFIGSSPAYPARELDEAKEIAKSLGVDFVIIETSEMEDPNFTSNPKERCYHCKLSLFDMMWEIAGKRGFKHVLEGSNVDDTKDFRPGRRAVKEKGVMSPLLMANLTKPEIREISRTMGLPTHDKPSYACLASRVPYGTRIDRDILGRIERSEEFLRGLGMSQVRVRYHGDVARIEVTEPDFDKLIRNREAIQSALKACGFTFATMDLKGYRTGSMNETSSERSGS